VVLAAITEDVDNDMSVRSSLDPTPDNLKLALLDVKFNTADKLRLLGRWLPDAITGIMKTSRQRFNWLLQRSGTATTREPVSAGPNTWPLPSSPSRKQYDSNELMLNLMSTSGIHHKDVYSWGSIVFQRGALAWRQDLE
jgi:hypothetical protein